MEKALAHLKKDKLLKKVIHKHGPLKTGKSTDLYFHLLRAIAGQQLSVKAASTIWERFLTLFKDGYPDPKKVLKLSDEKMRGIGLSYQKAGYIKNIARFSMEETLDHKKLKSKTDEELIEYLVQIKGVGKWTVEMILMFSMGREDIFPVGDLGIQQGIEKLYGLKFKDKKQLFSQMEKVAEKWRPYRTMACLYIWRHKDDSK
jgi:DNA-3-methyladenine glycosylase II